MRCIACRLRQDLWCAGIFCRVLSTLCIVLSTLAFASHADESPAALLVRAEAQLHSSGPAAALPIARASLAAFRAAADRAGEAHALRVLGNCHRRLGDYALALEQLDAALTLERARGDRLDEGKVLSLIGLVHWEQGDYARAEGQLAQAIAIAQDLGAAQLEAAALNNLSLIHDERGRYQESLAGYERVLELYRSDPLPHGTSDTLSNIGGVHLLLGRYQQALSYYERAFAIDSQLQNAPAMGTDFGNMALSWQGLGEFDKALAHFDQALASARTAGLQTDEAFWLKGKASVLLNLGRYDESLELHREALALYGRSGAQGEFIEASADFGELLLRLGDLAGAEAQFDIALKTARSIDHHRGETQALLRLGDVSAFRKQGDAAATRYRAALMRAEAIEDQARIAESLVQLASLPHADAAVAQAQAERALALSDHGAQPWFAARAQLALGRLAEAAGARERARAAYAAALRIALALGDPELLWRSHFGRARVLALDGDTDAAILALEQAVNVIESVRARLQQRRYRSGYLEDKYEVYVELVRLLLQADRVPQAFSVSEGLRAQAYSDMQVRSVQASSSPAEAALLQRIRTLQSSLQAEQTQPAAERRQSALQAFSSELAGAERAYAELRDEAAANPPRRRAPVDNGEIQRSLAPREAILGYVVGGSGLTAFVMTASHLRATHIELRRSDMRAKVELLRELILDTSSDAWRLPARSLAASLIVPLEQQGWLQGIDTIYLVPDAELNYLPFAALLRARTGEERLLVEDYVMQLLPAAAMILDLKPLHAGASRLLALAPATARLKHADAEARAIAGMRGSRSRLWTGSSATERRFKQHAGEFDVVHMATHGDFNNLNPAFSALDLEAGDGDDGKLQVQEILQLRLQASLVTLSACNTALGSGYFSDVPVGNEFVGLTRAFLEAGSGGVLSSLWAVDDRFTSTFMVDFYSAMPAAGYAAGLAQTQRRAAQANGRYGHPYYWAPYVLTGGPRGVASDSGKAALASVKLIRNAVAAKAP
jgi:CHAT domain-containing protein/tetratricopeptide (TPR) repeat protein